MSHFTPIARGPSGIQVARRLEATHGRALNDRAKRDADRAGRPLAPDDRQNSGGVKLPLDAGCHSRIRGGVLPKPEIY